MTTTDPPELPYPTQQQEAALAGIVEHVRGLNAALEQASDADLRCWIDIIPMTTSGRRYGRPHLRVTVSTPVEVS